MRDLSIPVKIAVWVGLLHIISIAFGAIEHGWTFRWRCEAAGGTIVAVPYECVQKVVVP